jgi:hypothetical protein
MHCRSLYICNGCTWSVKVHVYCCFPYSLRELYLMSIPLCGIVGLHACVELSNYGGETVYMYILNRPTLAGNQCHLFFFVCFPQVGSNIFRLQSHLSNFP